MSKTIYEEALDVIEKIDRNIPYTWLVGRDSLMKIKQILEQAKKQEKVLYQIKEIIGRHDWKMMTESERYYEIKELIKELR